MDPRNYDERSIKALRPPEVEGAVGDWQSRWLLRLRVAPTVDALRSLEQRLAAMPDLIGLSLTPLDETEVRLELRSVTHPLVPDSYPLIDHVLIAIDKSHGLVEINGAPRDWWRTFR